MIINKLKLKNFGQHESFDHEFGTSPIVGLTGVSGTGKSTILEAIKYAFTGKITDKAKEWINYGAKHALVELSFTKNGKQGFIKKKITPTSTTRELVWDDQEYKSAKQVDSLLTSLFGSDKEAISNAVFIGQGELHKILFGSETERCELFIKLINLNYCEKHVRVIDNYIKHLEGNTEDLNQLTGLLDNAKLNVQYYEQQVKEIKDELEQVQGYEKQYNIVTQYHLLKNALADAKTKEKEAYNDVQQIKNSIDPNMWSVEKCNENITNLENQLSNTQTEITKLKEKKQTVENYILLQNEIERIQKTLKELTQKLDQVDIDKSLKINPKQSREALSQQLRIYENINALSAEKNKYDEKHNELISTKIPKPADYKTQEEINQLRSKLDELKTELQTLLKWEAVQKEIKEKGVCDCENKCVNCGLELASTSSLTDESLQELQEIVGKKEQIKNQLKLQLDAASKAFQEYHQKITKYEQDKAAVVEQLTNISNKLKEQEQNLDKSIDLSENAIQTRINQIDHYLSVQEEVSNKRDIYVKQLVEKTNQKEQYKNIYELYQNVNLDQQIQEKENEITETKKQLTEFKNKRDEAQKLNQKLYTVQGLHQSNEQHRVETENKLQKHTYENNIDDSITQKNNDQLHAYIEQLKHNVNLENENKGKLHNAELSLKQAQQQKQELEQKASKYQSSIYKAKLLRNLKQVFQRDGLPMSCVNDYFHRIAELTQESLELMNVDFVVDVDTTKPVAFKFQKITDATRTWQGQHRLSGGEKVRLSVAFLLAVQQFLLPDFGFLVLDEPSQHLDEESRKNMADLLTQISGVLQNKENQIWVSDHSVELTTAFSKTITMK